VIGVEMRFDDVVAKIRCPICRGSGTAEVNPHPRTCETCDGTGINPDVVDEAGGWDSWAITVHERPGPIVVVPLDQAVEVTG